MEEEETASHEHQEVAPARALLSTPHWKNEHAKANSRVYLMPPPSLRRFEEDES